MACGSLLSRKGTMSQTLRKKRLQSDDISGLHRCCNCRTSGRCCKIQPQVTVPLCRPSSMLASAGQSAHACGVAALEKALTAATFCLLVVLTRRHIFSPTYCSPFVHLASPPPINLALHPHLLVKHIGPDHAPVCLPITAALSTMTTSSLATTPITFLSSISKTSWRDSAFAVRLRQGNLSLSICLRPGLPTDDNSAEPILSTIWPLILIPLLGASRSQSYARSATCTA